MKLRRSPFGLNSHRSIVNAPVMAIFDGKSDQRVSRVQSAFALDISLMHFNRPVNDGALRINVRELPSDLLGSHAFGDEGQ